jgi:branched-chain amino acid transport system substrate-binding protein
MFMSHVTEAAPSEPRSRKTLNRRAIAIGAGVVAVALALAGCSSSTGTTSGSKSPILLGISVPLSGAVGSSCTPMNQAMLAWFKHVNATGGVNGRKIKVDNRDDGYDASRAVTNTKAFIAEHVVAVTGQCGSLQPPAQVPLLTAAGIPFLFVFGASTTLLNPLSPDYFNLMPTYGDQLEATMPFALNKDGAGSVVVMNTTTPDSATSTQQVETATKKAGGTFLGSFTAPPGTADLTPYVLQAKALHPDYVVLNMIPQDAAVFTKAMVANDFIPPKAIIGSNAIGQTTFLATVDPSVQPKLMVASDTLVPSAAGNTECAKVLKAANIPIQSVTLRGCGTAQVDVKALTDIKGTITSAAIVKELESWKSVNASEIYKPLTFSSTNHVGVSSLYITGVKNGQFYNLGTVSAK